MPRKETIMIRKTRSKSNRGSALLMVVGLLTILALLGGTFLIVSRYERKQAQALESSPDPDARAQELFDTVRSKLVEDLYISGTSGPYSSAGSSNAETWRRFIDCPPCDEIFDKTDFWLASFEKNAGNVWPQISCVVSDVPDKNAYLNQSNDLFDTDGDNIGDSKESDLNIALLNGNRYAVSARIVDLSGLLNLNTVGATNPSNIWTTVCPASINLVGLQKNTLTIDTNILTLIANGANGAQGRNGTNTSATLQTYYDTCGYRFPSPASGSGYTPFSTSDEQYLRWLSTTNPKQVGRIYEITKNLASDSFGPSLRKYLTTASTSRSTLRYPESGFTTRLDLTYAKLSSTADRQKLYKQLCETIDKSVDSKRKEMAQFVANLWSYTATKTEISTNNFAFQPLNPAVATPIAETFTVYGAVPQLVITDVFAAHAAPTQIDATDPTYGDPNFWKDDCGYAYAIELINPTNVTISVSNYSITCNGTTTALSTILGAATEIQPGRTIVLYNFSGKANDKGKDISALFSKSTNWYSCTALDFNKSNASTSVKITESRGGTNFIIDEVKLSDIGWPTDLDITDKLEDPEATTEDDRKNRSICAGCIRDDSVTKLPTSGRDRVIVGGSGDDYAYAKIGPTNKASDSDITTACSPLGKSPNYDTDATATSAITCPQGFSLNFDTKNYTDSEHKILNFADIANIYIVGPSPTESLPKALGQYRDDTSKGKANFSSAYPSGKYPDVPWGTLVNEITEVLKIDNSSPTTEALSKIYGRININTASQEVLMQLPFYIDVNFNGICDTGENPVEMREDFAKAIIAYRNNESVSTAVGLDFDRAACGVTNSRTATTGSNYRGFLTPGEVALPVYAIAGKYAEKAGATVGTTKYQTLVNSAYKSIANLVTVNSDTFAVYITVHLKKPLGSSEILNSWRYLAIYDRSGCTTNDPSTVSGSWSRIK